MIWFITPVVACATLSFLLITIAGVPVYLAVLVPAVATLPITFLIRMIVEASRPSYSGRSYGSSYRRSSDDGGSFVAGYIVGSSFSDSSSSDSSSDCGGGGGGD